MGDLPIEKIHRFVDNFIHKHLTKMFYANNDDFAKTICTQTLIIILCPNYSELYQSL